MTKVATVFLHNEPATVYRRSEDIPLQNLLRWLRQQPRHPKFYWRSKDGQEEIAASGQLLKIFQIPQFADGSDPDIKFFGYETFEGSETLFFLPTLEVHRVKNRVTFSQNYLSENTPHIPFCFNATHETSEKIYSTRSQYFPDEQKWASLHAQALSTIEKGLLQKVVLARKARHQLSQDPDSISLFQELTETSKSSYLFFLEKKIGLSFFGASPERLYSRKGNSIECDILAGTRRRGDTIQEDSTLRNELLQDEKESLEFQIVQDWVEMQMTQLCSESQISNKSILATQNVQHLHSLCEGKLKTSISDAEIVKTLHPTPAIGGFPRAEAIDFLYHHDILRNLYSAPFGWISADRAEVLVAIRSASIEGRKLDLYSGTGIVKGSKAESEWQEHNHKIQIFQSIIEGKHHEPAVV